MFAENLLTFDYEEFESFDNAIGEILLRKVLHKLGFNQRDLILDLGYFDVATEDMIMAGLDAARNVFKLLGYMFGELDEKQFDLAMDDYNKYYYVDLSVPELNSWSAHRLNPYRDPWKDYFKEIRYKDPDYEVRLRTIRSRQSVLRFRFNLDSGRQLFFQLPTLVENFLHWREEMLEVVKGDSVKRQIAS